MLRYQLVAPIQRVCEALKYPSSVSTWHIQLIELLQQCVAVADAIHTNTASGVPCYLINPSFMQNTVL